MTAEPLAASSLLPPRPDLSGARLRLFETALLLFGDRGYHAVSVRDLAQAMGQRPGALYFHVPSKQQLLFELLHIGHEEHLACLREALLDTGREPAEQLGAVTRAHVLWHLTYQSLARVASRETRALSGEELQQMAQVRVQSEQVFLDVIERGKRLGVFDAAEDSYLAMKAIAAMGIRAAEWWTPDSPYAREQLADGYARFAVKLLT